MARTGAERQAAYRKRRPMAGKKGDGDRRINSWVTTATALALSRLARRYGVTQRVMLEQLIIEADERIVTALDPDTPEWNGYFNVTP